MVRHLLYACLAVSCGCELIVDDGTRTVAIPDEASDGLDAAVARDAPAQGTDADTGRLSHDASDASDASDGQDEQAADSARVPPPADAGCGQDCASLGMTCVQGCAQAEATCESHCKGNDQGCMNKCSMAERDCAQMCGMQCMMCFMGESCPPHGGAWSCDTP